MRRKSAIGGLAAACLWFLVMTGAASAAAGPQTFRIIFTGDPREGAAGRVIAQGVVQGAGLDRNVGHVENPDGSSTDLDQIVLPGGTITIENVETITAFDLNPLSCVAHATGTGTYTVADSTGAYAGATGSGTFIAHATFIFSRTPTGCSEAPRVFFADVLVTGTMTLP